MVKLKAYALIETLTASIIIIIIAAVTSLTVVNIFRFDNYSVKTRAYFILEQVKNNTRENKLFFNDEIEIENIRIVKKFYEYDKNKNLYVISYNVFFNKKEILTESKEIIIKQE